MKPLTDTVVTSAVTNNKIDKWKIEKPLKWLFGNGSSSSSSINSNSNGTLVSKSSHGSMTMPKKTDAPMLNLVYDSHIKPRHPDFRYVIGLKNYIIIVIK